VLAYITFINDSVSIVQGRILMEMNYMLAYGSAEASLRLLWKFGILEILLPIQVNGIRVYLCLFVAPYY